MQDKLESSSSFTSRYKLRFDAPADQWVFQVSADAITPLANGFFEVRLPVYAGRAMAIGGNILRNLRKEYRQWLLEQQGGTCPICGQGDKLGDPWNLDHQPPMAANGSRFIDYHRKTQNRVIHKGCDPSQNKRRRST